MKYLLSPSFPLSIVAAFSLLATPALGQGTAFTYQGHLSDGGQPANGDYGMVFYLCNNPAFGGQLGNLGIASVPVSNGVFRVTLNFGDGMFPGADRWLEITVKTNGAAAFTILSPRQKITPTPYAITAGSISGTLPVSQLSGAIPLSQLPSTLVTNNQSGVNFNGTFSGNGGGLTKLDYDALTNSPAPQVFGSAGAAVLAKLLSSKPVRIAYMGDSMSEFRAGWTSASSAFHDEMVKRYGSAGTIFQSTPSTAGASLPFTLFPEGCGVTSGNGGVLYWQMLSGASRVKASRVGVYWLAWPGGGSVNLIHFNGDPPAPYGNLTYYTNTSYPGVQLDGFAATPTVRYTNWFGWNETNNVIHLSWLTGGTNIILGVEYINTNGPGAISVPYALASATVQQLTNIGTNLLRQLFGLIQPDMVIYHDKTGVDEQSVDIQTNALYQALTFARGTSTSNTIVFFGTPEGAWRVGYDEIANALGKQTVNRIPGGFYLDLNGKFPDGAYQFYNGLSDSLHPTALAAPSWGHEILRQLGFDYPVSTQGLTTRIFMVTNTIGQGVTLQFTDGILKEVQ